MPDGVRCADSADARGESLYGTASVVRRWLLLEQPGSWGHDALLESRLPDRGAHELRRRARASGIRVVLIRRGVRLASAKRQCYFAFTTPTSSWTRRLALDGFDDLLDVDLTPLEEGAPIQGSVPQDGSLFLVCTHGRHDACCSIRGNQVSRIVCAEPDVDAWECSHIGGDRFAANLVCFPHGIYYGRVGAADVLSLVKTHRSGAISLEHYRGRCCYPFWVQAAEYFARRESGVIAIDDVALVDVSDVGEAMSALFSLRGRGRVEVRIRASTWPGRHRLTCGSSRAEPIPRYELAGFRIDRELRDA